MAQFWLKIWPKVKENGTKKIKLAKMVAKEKKNPSANPESHNICFSGEMKYYVDTSYYLELYVTNAICNVFKQVCNCSLA